jgi:hypothetical protein
VVERTSDYYIGGFLFLRITEMNELKRGDELQLEITDAAFEELEACNYNTRSVFLFRRTQC